HLLGVIRGQRRLRRGAHCYREASESEPATVLETLHHERLGWVPAKLAGRLAVGRQGAKYRSSASIAVNSGPDKENRAYSIVEPLLTGASAKQQATTKRWSEHSMRPTDIRIQAVTYQVEDFLYRTPIKFGGIAVDRVTLLNVEIEVRTVAGRSEERRVGKECRARWWA